MDRCVEVGMRQSEPAKPRVRERSNGVSDTAPQAIVHAAELAAGNFAPTSASAQVLIEFLRPVVTRRVLRVLKSSGIEAELEDRVQDMFVWLLSNERRVLRLWTPEKGLSLRNFVGMVCERRIRSQLRSSSRSTVLMLGQDADSVVEHPDPEAQVITQNALRMLFTNLETALTPLGMSVFRLIYIHEESVDSVSAALAMSTDAVYAWRRRLRAVLESLVRELNGRDSVSDFHARRPIPKRA